MILGECVVAGCRQHFRREDQLLVSSPAPPLTKNPQSIVVWLRALLPLILIALLHAFAI